MTPTEINAVTQALICMRDRLTDRGDRDTLADACNALDGYAKQTREMDEYRSALTGLWELCLNAKPDAFQNGVTDSTGSVDEGDVRASDRMKAAQRLIEKFEGKKRFPLLEQTGAK